MSDNNERKVPHHPIPQGGWHRRYIWIFALLAIIPLLSLCGGRKTLNNATISLNHNGVTVTTSANKVPITLEFGMSIAQVRDLLGMESLVDGDLYIYANVGLTLYFFDDQLQIIAAFSSQNLNPSALLSTWQVENVRIDAGMFGSPFKKAVKNITAVSSWQLIDDGMAKFGILGNTLQLNSDNRDRVVVIVYSYQNFTINNDL